MEINTNVSLDVFLKWLFSLLPSEEQCRDFYIRNQTLPGKEDFNTIFPAGSRFLSNDIHNAFSPHYMTVSPIQGNIRRQDEFRLFFPNLDIFIQRHPRYSAVPMHMHDYFEIAYVYEGNCLQSIEKQGMSFPLTLNTGDFIFIPPDHRHSISVDNDSVVLNIGVRASTFTNTFSQTIPADSILGQYFFSILSGHDNVQYVIFHTGKDNISLKNLLHELCLTYCGQGCYSANIMNLQLGLLLLSLLQNYSTNTEIYNDSGNSRCSVPVLIEYMEEHFASTSVADIAAHFGYSSDYLNQLFKKFTSLNLSEMLMQIKMRNAASMLLGTSLSTAEIAAAIGYQETSTFIRNFKKLYQCTPSKYKKSGGEPLVSPGLK